METTVDGPTSSHDEPAAARPIPAIRLIALGVVLAGLAGAAGFGLTRQTAPVVAATRTTTVAKGNVSQIVSVAGSVNASTQTKLNFNSSGKLAALYVVVGGQVSAGQQLAKLDTTDLQAALTTAQNDLSAAQTSYDKAVAGTSDAQATLSQTQQSTASDIAAAQQALAKLKASYAAATGSFTNLSMSVTQDVRTFTSNIDGARIQIQQTLKDMSERSTPDVTAARNSLFSADTSLVNAESYANTQLTAALSSYTVARDALGSAIAGFDNAMAAGGDTSTANSTYQAALSVYSNAVTQLASALDAPNSALSSAQSAVGSAQQSINTTTSRADGYLDQARADFVGLQSQLTTQTQLVSALKSRIGQITTGLATVTDAISGSSVAAIQNIISTQVRSAQSVQSAQTALNNQPSNVRSALNSLQTMQTAVQSAQNNLDAAVLKAPTAGVVSIISSQVGEIVASSATGFVVIANTSSLVVHGTIGEGDVSKLKLGQTATVTVDAVGTARLTGKVTSVDPVATIASGVPVYGVDVTLDSANASIKPGMTGTASVVIASAQGVLTAPNLAVKTKGGQSYVTISKDGQQVDTSVTIGLSDSTSTEIKSGVALGDTLVITSNTRSTTTTTTSGSGFRIGGN